MGGAPTSHPPSPSTQYGRDGAPYQCSLSEVCNKLPLPLYADMRFHIPMTHDNDAGRPDISSRVLAAAEKEFPLFTPYAKLWAATQCQIKHQQALYDENWSDAAAVSLELNGLVGSLNESSLDAEYRRALILQERRQYVEAGTVVAQLLWHATEGPHSDAAMPSRAREVGAGPLGHIKLLRLQMMQAEIRHASGNHFGALQVVLKCISMAEQYNASLLRALSLALLADVELAMGINEHGFSAISDAMPTLLAHGSMESRGYARQVYGKCQFAVAMATGGKAAGGVAVAISSMVKARALFSSIGAKRREREVLYCLARMHHAVGNMAERNVCSRDFRMLQPITVE